MTSMRRRSASFWGSPSPSLWSARASPRGRRLRGVRRWVRSASRLSGRPLAQEMFELGEDLLDRVEKWGVFGQDDQLRARGANGLANGFAFVAAEVVHDHRIARPQGERENLLDIGFERLGVDRAVQNPRRPDAIAAQRGDESRSLPMAMGNLGHESLAQRRRGPAASDELTVAHRSPM